MSHTAHAQYAGTQITEEGRHTPTTGWRSSRQLYYQYNNRQSLSLKEITFFLSIYLQLSLGFYNIYVQ
jgi:hypothetical protein